MYCARFCRAVASFARMRTALCAEKCAFDIENAVRSEHVNMRVEGDEIAESLDEENHARPVPLADACIGPNEQPLYDVAQPAQQCAPAGIDRAQHAGHGQAEIDATLAAAREAFRSAA